MQKHQDYQEAEISIGSDNYFPFKEDKLNNNTFDREFEEDIDIEDLVWHRDKNTRIVEILDCGKDWKIQFENKLPENIEIGKMFFIEKEIFHRVIKGTGKLKIKIKEIV